MTQIDAVVLPTRWNEPFGRTVAESAISGKVVYTPFNESNVMYISKRKTTNDFVDTLIMTLYTRSHKHRLFFLVQKTNDAVHTHIYNPVAAIEYVPTVNEKVRIGFVGRLTEDKGFDEFCALAKQASGDPQVAFYAAGRFNGDAAGERLKVLALEAGIHLLGFIKIEEFMTQIDAVVLPTRWNEPFGR
ncbi:glycosyltransferase, partial [Serratia marcescens]|uniref:glycosyltransferase n=1 Tax=Serratia marcescens TaxID=615 RepID=UPI00201B8447